MMRVSPKALGRSLTLLLGTAVGVAAAFFVGRALQLRMADRELHAYVQRLMFSGSQLAVGANAAWAMMDASPAQYCTEEALAVMRLALYKNTDLKDIQTTHKGMIVCTAAIGRLPKPVPLPQPDMVIGDMNVYAYAPIVGYEQSQGLILESDGEAIVINPASRQFDEPPLLFSGLLLNRAKGTFVRGFGHPVTLSDADVLAGRPVERDGMVYLPGCSDQYLLCVVGMERRSDILARERPLLLGCLATGALLGAALAALALLLYERQGTMEQQLRRAVKNDGFTLVYQPIVSLVHGRIVGAEALVRWVDEAGETVRPDIFIDLAERKGFISDITLLVLRRAVTELGDLLRGPDFRLTINIAAGDLASEAFFSALERCRHDGVAAAALGLEITERSTAGARGSVEAIARLAHAGHKVYIDDFGTGYSSLSYLHELAVAVIKVDRAFTKTVGTGSATASVVPQILDMASKLKLLVVVEGIETEEQAAYFRTADEAILGQGWLFGKPVPAAQFRRLLEGSTLEDHRGRRDSRVAWR